MRTLIALLLVVAFAGFTWLSLPGLDQAQAPGAQTTSGSGVVLGIDLEKGMVTISHGPLPALNMSSMTMGYPITDKRQLSGFAQSWSR